MQPHFIPNLLDDSLCHLFAMSFRVELDCCLTVVTSNIFCQRIRKFFLGHPLRSRQECFAACVLRYIFYEKYVSASGIKFTSGMEPATTSCFHLVHRLSQATRLSQTNLYFHFQLIMIYLASGKHPLEKILLNSISQKMVHVNSYCKRTK